MRLATKPTKTGLMTAITLSLIVSIIASGAQASPPHPDLVKRIRSGDKSVPYYMAHLGEMHEKGISTGERAAIRPSVIMKSAGDQTPGFAGDFRILALLVEFSDHPAATAPVFYDNLVFGEEYPSVRDYYQEVSYGQIDLVTVNVPSSLNWLTPPETYAYYVNGQNGTGSYPTNSQKMVEDLVDQIDPVVDFSDYDNDGDGYVDVIIVIHSGSGAEYTGSDDDMWSHKWGINARQKDGVYIQDFTVQPEYWLSSGDMTIGVYAHELGHAFGLPDLYDIDYTSYGIGDWGIMSFGSWLGPHNRGGCPAHFCAWSKTQIGVVEPAVLTANSSNHAITNVEDSPEILRLWNSGNIDSEYFLVENRRKIGYDSYLPGEGLLIWHIDDDKLRNDREWWPGMAASDHLGVALEQADGLFELEHKLDAGDNIDPFPGAFNVTSFNTLTQPSSESYDGFTSYVAVENISQSGDTVYADLMVGLSAGEEEEEEQPDEEVLLPTSIELSQNYPNPFNPATTIGFSSSTTGRARIDVYNCLGQQVASIFDDVVTPGYWTASWDASGSDGQTLSSGVYFYRLSLAGQEQTKKMILVR